MILNGVEPSVEEEDPIELPSAETMEQSAEFFNPKNEKASAIREQVALSTLDELLDFLLDQGGTSLTRGWACSTLSAQLNDREWPDILFQHAPMV